MRSAYLFSFITMTLITIISCSKGGDDNNGGSGGGGGGGGTNCNGVAKSFSANVNPIIQTYCNQAGCHAAGSTNGPGPLTNYIQVYNARTQVRSAIQSGLMPQNATLSATQKSAIICWIDNGAADD